LPPDQHRGCGFLRLASIFLRLIKNKVLLLKGGLRPAFLGLRKLHVLGVHHHGLLIGTLVLAKRHARLHRGNRVNDV
jgi:hypothetical protein